MKREIDLNDVSDGKLYDNNDFEEDYIMWQVASDGIVPGISGYVDLDIIKNTIFE